MKPKTKSEETRARILDAAMDLFRRQGFEEATMREIAAEAGVATGAAYYYFESKDAIVLAFYDQAQKEMEPRLEQALGAEPDRLAEAAARWAVRRTAAPAPATRGRPRATAAPPTPV